MTYKTTLSLLNRISILIEIAVLLQATFCGEPTLSQSLFCQSICIYYKKYPLKPCVQESQLDTCKSKIPGGSLPEGPDANYQLPGMKRLNCSDPPLS